MCRPETVPQEGLLNQQIPAASAPQAKAYEPQRKETGSIRVDDVPVSGVLFVTGVVGVLGRRIGRGFITLISVHRSDRLTVIPRGNRVAGFLFGIDGS